MAERLRGWWRYPFSVAGPLSVGMFATVGLVGVLSAELIASSLEGLVLAAVVLLGCGEVIRLFRGWFIRRRSIVVPATVRQPLRAQLTGAVVVAISTYSVLTLHWKLAWIIVLLAGSGLSHEVYMRRRWTKAGKPGDPRGAIDWSPETDPAYEYQAFPLLKSGEYLEAKRLFEMALERKPTDSFVLYNLACAEARLGQDRAALEHLNAVVANNARLLRLAQRDKDLASIRDDPRFPGAESR